MVTYEEYAKGRKARHQETVKAGFKPGMRLELWDFNLNTIDPATVREIDDDGRLWLHYDDWEDKWDLHLKPSNPWLHPIGYAEQNKIPMTPPPASTNFSIDGVFDWDSYLSHVGAIAVPFSLFTKEQAANTTDYGIFRKARKALWTKQIDETMKRGFTPNTQLELWDEVLKAIDPATIVGIDRQGLLWLHYDNWGPEWDLHLLPTSPWLHPIGYAKAAGLPLNTPPDYKPEGADFDWTQYLKKTGRKPVPTSMFTKEQRGNVTSFEEV